MFCSVAAPVLQRRSIEATFGCLHVYYFYVSMYNNDYYVHTCVYMNLCMDIYVHIMYFPINCIFCILWIDIIIISAECFQSFSLSPSETDVGPMLV